MFLYDTEGRVIQTLSSDPSLGLASNDDTEEIKNNEIEIFDKMQKIDITNTIIQNFNEKTINDAYFKQFMHNLLDKTNYPKEITKLANKSIY